MDYLIFHYVQSIYGYVDYFVAYYLNNYIGSIAVESNDSISSGSGSRDTAMQRYGDETA